MDFMTKYAYEHGYLPDKFWYQLNGETAQSNYADFKRKQFADSEEEELRIVVVEE